MLGSVVDRLSRTLPSRPHGDLPFRHFATGTFLLAKSFGMTQTGGLDFSFLNDARPESEEGHLFFENTHQVPRESASAREGSRNSI